MNDWQRGLADPEKQWRTGYSAKTLAACWEAQKGELPPEISALLPAGLAPLLIIPEWKTMLPGGSRASQSDIFLLAKAPQGLFVAMIEGKVNESFDKLTSAWLGSGTPGKQTRLEFLCSTLGISRDAALTVRYQLLHRTASALIEAKRFGADSAAMIVHSFSLEHLWFEDFRAFAACLGVKSELSESTETTMPGGIRLTLGWACGDPRFLEH
jgi:hypothetical protein